MLLQFSLIIERLLLSKRHVIYRILLLVFLSVDLRGGDTSIGSETTVHGSGSLGLLLTLGYFFFQNIHFLGNTTFIDSSLTRRFTRDFEVFTTSPGIS